MKQVLRGGPMWALSYLAVATAVIAGSAQPVSAADGSDSKLIDKPFEQCLIKHFQTRFFNRIDASPKQRQKLGAIFARRSEETRPVREQLRQGYLELSEMLAKEDATDEQLTAKAHEVRGLRDKVMDERINSVLEARAVLTPAQRRQISDKISGLISGQWKHSLARTQ